MRRKPVVRVIAVIALVAIVPLPALAGVTTRVSVASDGTQGNGGSYGPSISADGRFVAFGSNATNLVAGDTNGAWDAFVHDNLTGQTTRVSVASNGTQGNGDSYGQSISADGRCVAFMSSATNLVAGDTNGAADVFVRDMQTGLTTRVSVASDGTQGNDTSYCYCLSISADGRFVAFDSYSSNLVAGDTKSLDVFVHDRQTGQTTCPTTAVHSWCSYHPSMSADGRYVAFVAHVICYDCGSVFVHDQQTGETACVSVAYDGQPEWFGSNTPSISADGRYIAFASPSGNLVYPCIDGWHSFVRDMCTGRTSCVSVASDGTLENSSDDHYSSISGDGRFVAFESAASNLVSGDTNGCADVFVRDCSATGTPPPNWSGPGWDARNGSTISLRNPYYGYSTARRAKGEMHCHFYDDWEREQGKWSITPTELLAKYGEKGYDFVCITEHYHCTTAPAVASPLYINYCEEVTVDSKHVLALGIDTSGCAAKASGPGGDESRYSPFDTQATTNGLCEIELFERGDVPARVSKIHDWGGMAIIAHPSIYVPSLTDNRVSEDEILEARPDAMSIYTAALPFSAEDKWDAVLARGASGPTGMPLFCAAEDDFTPVVGQTGFARTWVVADLDTDSLTTDAVMRALKLGRYWCYFSPLAQSGNGPILTLTTYQNAEGKWEIHVTSTEPVDKFTFVRRKRDTGREFIDAGSGTVATPYVCDGDEVYVRVEVKKGWIWAVSQPIGIDWNWSSGGGGSPAPRPEGMAVMSVPADIVYTCAQPEELPEKMPPLGYIGRPYLVSTSGGSYLPDATFTLSYEGIDVTPYGTSNLAIYRWDSAASAWVKLAGTIDIGNALVTAPLTQAGLYTISAQIIGDTTAPTVTVHSPTDGATMTGPDVIGVQAYDNVGVQRVTFYLNDQCIGTDSSGWDGYTCPFDFSRKSAGPYVLKVMAEDVSGNTGSAQTNINISSSGVTPSVTITSPTNGATLTATAPVTGTCSDNSLVAGVFICVDGVPLGEATVSGTAWSYNLDTSLVANGPHTLSAKVMDDDRNTSEQAVNVTVSGATLASISAARQLDDGQRARLSGRVVTLGSPGDNGAFYIEELTRFAGIRVQGSLVPAQGDMVSVSGLMSTLEGERVLAGADVLTISSSNPLPVSLGVANALLGGSGISGALGLNNTGLLVRSWGKITQIGDGYLYIDDGSSLKDGTLTGATANVGVRIICDPSGHSSGQYVGVTGISSCFAAPSGQIARRIITRGVQDMNPIGSL